jgi:hypothetical protein
MSSSKKKSDLGQLLKTALVKLDQQEHFDEYMTYLSSEWYYTAEDLRLAYRKEKVWSDIKLPGRLKIELASLLEKKSDFSPSETRNTSAKHFFSGDDNEDNFLYAPTSVSKTSPKVSNVADAKVGSPPQQLFETYEVEQVSSPVSDSKCSKDEVDAAENEEIDFTEEEIASYVRSSWVKCWAPEHECYYYYNTYTQESEWEDPLAWEDIPVVYDVYEYLEETQEWRLVEDNTSGMGGQFENEALAESGGGAEGGGYYHHHHNNSNSYSSGNSSNISGGAFASDDKGSSGNDGSNGSSSSKGTGSKMSPVPVRSQGGPTFTRPRDTNASLLFGSPPRGPLPLPQAKGTPPSPLLARRSNQDDMAKRVGHSLGRSAAPIRVSVFELSDEEEDTEPDSPVPATSNGRGKKTKSPSASAIARQQHSPLDSRPMAQPKLSPPKSGDSHHEGAAAATAAAAEGEARRTQSQYAHTHSVVASVMSPGGSEGCKADGSGAAAGYPREGAILSTGAGANRKSPVKVSANNYLSASQKVTASGDTRDATMHNSTQGDHRDSAGRRTYERHQQPQPQPRAASAGEEEPYNFYTDYSEDTREKLAAAGGSHDSDAGAESDWSENENVRIRVKNPYGAYADPNFVQFGSASAAAGSTKGQGGGVAAHHDYKESDGDSYYEGSPFRRQVAEEAGAGANGAGADMYHAGGEGEGEGEGYYDYNYDAAQDYQYPSAGQGEGEEQQYEYTQAEYDAYYSSLALGGGGEHGEWGAAAAAGGEGGGAGEEGHAADSWWGADQQYDPLYSERSNPPLQDQPYLRHHEYPAHSYSRHEDPAHPAASSSSTAASSVYAAAPPSQRTRTYDRHAYAPSAAAGSAQPSAPPLPLQEEGEEVPAAPLSPIATPVGDDDDDFLLLNSGEYFLVEADADYQPTPSRTQASLQQMALGSPGGGDSDGDGGSNSSNSSPAKTPKKHKSKFNKVFGMNLFGRGPKLPATPPPPRDESFNPHSSAYRKAKQLERRQQKTAKNHTNSEHGQPSQASSSFPNLRRKPQPVAPAPAATRSSLQQAKHVSANTQQVKKQENVQLLIDMGYEESESVLALHMCNNDLGEATSMLADART